METEHPKLCVYPIFFLWQNTKKYYCSNNISNIMLRQYKYLYYRIYSWNLKKWGKNDISEWKAVVIVSFMMALNLFFLELLFQFFGILEHPFPKKISTPLMLVLIGLNYFLFMHSKKYEQIARECEKESTKKRKKNSILLWLYTTLSFLLPILLMFLIRDKYYS